MDGLKKPQKYCHVLKNTFLKDLLDHNILKSVSSCSFYSNLKFIKDDQKSSLSCHVM